MPENSLIINKAFFGGRPGAKNVLKITLNKNKECYFNFGIEQQNSKYLWIPCKMNASELGDIINVLTGKISSIAFFHKFNGKKGETTRQIWINRSDDKKTVFIKVKELTKPLSMGEQKVLELLLSQIIVRLSLS